jgi:replicative DNA helicase
MRKVLPFLKDEYFSVEDDRLLYKEIKDFILKYNNLPTYDALLIEIDNLAGLKEDQVKSINQTLKEISEDKIDTNIDWLTDNTEKFCQEKAIYHAIMSSIEIMNNKNGALSKGAIPGLLSDALGVTFNPSVGHDLFEDWEERYDYYHRAEEKLPLDLDHFNRILKGGIAKKTLNMLLGGVHTGKTMFMCHFSAAYLSQGKNVLYISLEMSEEEITKRIECNLLNIDFDTLDALSKDMYEKKIKKAKIKTNGKLIVKEYGATSASVTHFAALLSELKLKKHFVPDVIMIDYINLCASSRLKAASASDTYTYVKAVAEEVRGFAKIQNLPIWSATQLNRAGFGNSDPDMTNTSESFGLPATVDLLLVLVATDELRALNQILVKQLKNRYRDMELDKRFVVGVDKTKMKLYNLEQSAQEDIVDSGQEKPVFDKSNSATRDKFKRLKV